MRPHPDLAAMRSAYARTGLDEAAAPGEPLELFDAWMADAVAAGLPEPNAMVVATATADGVPSARTVLLKGADERGFTFFTNTLSRKGTDLAENPRAALVFPWHALERQVRVGGPVSVVERREVADYFASRPHGSRLGAWASPQSRVIGSRADLDARLAAVTHRWPADVDVPLPDFWGGYRVVPEEVEFWSGRADRLHDRLRYRRAADASGGWVLERLAP
jgi:pyridoxamine 5'-phosphate oxidase